MIARLGATRDRALARLETIRRRLLAIRPFRLGLDVLAVYDRAGGGLLTAGLAYRVLVTLLPGLALVAGTVGLVSSDPATREEIARRLVEALPPLEPIVGDALLALASGGAPLSLLGLVGLGWASSALYGTLDDALARVFAGAPRRDLVRRRVIGVLAVALALGLVVAALTVTTLAVVVLAGLGAGSAGTAIETVVNLGGMLAPVALTTLVYAALPRRGLPRRIVLVAGLVTGGLIIAFTAIFAFIAPRLVGGSLALFGSFVALFAALVWLGFVVQITLLGAAWIQVVTRGRPAGRGDPTTGGRAAIGGGAAGGAAAARETTATGGEAAARGAASAGWPPATRGAPARETDGPAGKGGGSALADAAAPAEAGRRGQRQAAGDAGLDPDRRG